MPFIDTKVTMQLSDDKKESIKSRLGEAIGTLHKTETYLMVGFSDEYDLFLGGKKLEKGAYVEVSLFGGASSGDYNAMTGKICDILSEELAIPADSVYVTYHGLSDWGWNGRNF